MKSPWIEAVAWMCASEDEWASVLDNIPPALPKITEFPDAAIYEIVKESLGEVFILTPKIKAIVRTLAGHAFGVAYKRYPDKESFLRAIYSNPSQRKTKETFNCITGPAGVGKTEAIQAFHKLGRFFSASEILIDGHCPLTHQIAWNVKIEGGDSILSTLGRLAESARHELLSSTVDDVSRELSGVALRNGTCSLVVDELQFVSQGNSTSKISSILLRMAQIGVPVTFAANISLVQKFKKAASERRHRFLEKAQVLLPELPQSAAWHEMLSAYGQVLHKSIDVDFENPEVRTEIWCMTLGLPRLLKTLFSTAAVLALSSKNKLIDIDVIRSAYDSSTWQFNREQVEDTRRYLLGNAALGKKHTDLASNLVTKDLVDDQAQEILELRQATLDAMKVDREMFANEQRSQQSDPPPATQKKATKCKRGPRRGKLEESEQELIHGHSQAL